ncbi:hypothetical protein [Mucilaginibacter paludis]|uniref:UspA domain-containing protein n=1 Tax=Mucilaginibacter paludis DSM 18603 TaxID=714943 RepID=H1Y808_9SPHI|nr:hypothetical protein [Mucilaginibacter paludis]EHQ30494.1 hypothetical protein Mucpa_6441 [Mucilaginibacter paludis DSM 18603]
MKTILIPTDFKVESLNCISDLFKRVYPEKLNIILVHMLDITDSIQELLMLSRRSTEYKHISPEFYKALAQIKANYADRLDRVNIEFFFGSTVAVFKNFLEANQVDSVVLLNDYHYDMLTEDGIDPLLLVNRSKAHVIHLDWNPVIKYTLPKLKQAVTTPAPVLIESNSY